MYIKGTKTAPTDYVESCDLKARATDSAVSGVFLSYTCIAEEAQPPYAFKASNVTP